MKAPEVFTIEFEQAPVSAAPQYVWTVTYAPASYLESTSKSRLVVVGGSYLNADAQGTNLQVAGYQVKVSDEKSQGIAKASVFVRQSDSASGCGALALGGSSKEPVNVAIGGKKYKLYPGAMLLISRTTSSGLPDVACVTPLTTAAPLPEYLPRMVLMQTKEVPLRNELHYPTEASSTGLAERTSPKASSIQLSNVLPVSLINTDGRPVTNFPGTCLIRNAQMQRLDKRHYALTKGSVLAQLNEPVRFETPHGTVLADKGSVVMITAGPRLTRVRNFVDMHEGSVRLVSNQSEVVIEPGKEYNVSTMKSDVLQLVLADGLARRNIVERQAGQNHVVMAEFSILHALLSQPLMVEARSTQSPNTTRMLDQILKTAASLNLVIDRYKGPYYAPPKGTSGGIAETATEIAL